MTLGGRRTTGPCRTVLAASRGRGRGGLTAVNGLVGVREESRRFDGALWGYCGRHVSVDCAKIACPPLDEEQRRAGPTPPSRLWGVLMCPSRIAAGVGDARCY